MWTQRNFENLQKLQDKWLSMAEWFDLIVIEELLVRFFFHLITQQIVIKSLRPIC